MKTLKEFGCFLQLICAIIFIGAFVNFLICGPNTKYSNEYSNSNYSKKTYSEPTKTNFVSFPSNDRISNFQDLNNTKELISNENDINITDFDNAKDNDLSTKEYFEKLDKSNSLRNEINDLIQRNANYTNYNSTNYNNIPVSPVYFSTSTNPEHVRVEGYLKENGTYVESYIRTAPNSTTDDNFSSTE